MRHWTLSRGVGHMCNYRQETIIICGTRTKPLSTVSARRSKPHVNYCQCWANPLWVQFEVWTSNTRDYYISESMIGQEWWMVDMIWYLTVIMLVPAYHLLPMRDKLLSTFWSTIHDSAFDKNAFSPSEHQMIEIIKMLNILNILHFEEERSLNQSHKSKIVSIHNCDLK